MDFEIRLKGAFEPLLNTNDNLEELYEKFVLVINKVLVIHLWVSKEKRPIVNRPI